MPEFALTSADDPLGLAGDEIQLTDVQQAAVKDYSESLGDSAKYVTNATKALRPRDEGSCSYELFDTASLVAAFGAAVNTDYIITGLSANLSATARPTVTLNWIKPSAIAKLKAYGSSVSQTIGGGFGVVNLFGASIAGSAEAISATVSIEMQTADAGLGTDADYVPAGLYYYGFKRSVSLQAYGVITIPAAGYSTNKNDTGTLGREGWKVFSADWWEYLDATTLV